MTSSRPPHRGIQPEVRSRKPTIGIVGGIGSGKSRVAAEFAAAGCVVIDSDRENHAVLNLPEVQAQLVAWWGGGVVRPDGQTDRRRIADIVFRDDAERERLEGLVFPLIDARRRAKIEEVAADPAVQAIVLDSPLLMESGLDRTCDRIVFVEVREEQRLERLRRSRGWDAAELSRRERRQIPLDEKRTRADYVVSNVGPPEELRSQVRKILDKVASTGTSD